MKNKNEVSIYVLCEPDTNEPRYIGSTVFPKMRHRQHRQEIRIRARWASNRLTPKQRWMRDLDKNGKWPQMKIIDQCAESERGDVEDGWIKKYTDMGHNLLNAKKAGKKKY